MAEFIIGLDLGQAQDYTALCIMEKAGQELHLRHLNRFSLRTPYPAIVADLSGLMGNPSLKGQSVSLVVDATGVGRAVVDLIWEVGLSCVPVTITGGTDATFEGGSYKVPKRDLVGSVAVFLQTNRLKVAEGLPLVDVLVNELLNFKVKIDPVTAHDSYSAWREGIHDDLVLSVALACWYANIPKPGILWLT